MVYELITAVLAVIGVLSLVWWIIFLSLRPRSRDPYYITVQPHNADKLTSDTMGLEWLRWWGVDVRLLIAVDMLDDEGLHMARLLARDNKAVTLGKMEDFYSYDGRTPVGRNPFGHLQ